MSSLPVTYPVLPCIFLRCTSESPRLEGHEWHPMDTPALSQAGAGPWKGTDTRLSGSCWFVSYCSQGSQSSPLSHPQHNPTAAAHMTHSRHRSHQVLHKSHSHPADICLGHEFTTAGGTRRQPDKLVNRTHLYPLLALNLR